MQMATVIAKFVMEIAEHVDHKRVLAARDQGPEHEEQVLKEEIMLVAGAKFVAFALQIRGEKTMVRFATVLSKIILAPPKDPNGAKTNITQADAQRARKSRARAKKKKAPAQ